jgi:beta-lactamase class D
MSKLVINDLAVSKDLDQAAVMKICGGFSLGWTVARNPQASSALAPTSIYNVTNNYIDYDYNVINQNPTFFNVYNGDGNSGTIVNSFNTLSLTAGSPALIS